MRTLRTEDARIERYDPEEEVPASGADYVIRRLDVLNAAREAELLKEGFAFLDRILVMEIDLRAASDAARIAGIEGIELVRTEAYDPAVYDLSYRAYVTDRRFHLEPVFDMDRARPVIRAYIDDCRDRGLPIYQARHRGELLGCAIVDERADARGTFFENVLGATTPGIKGKMIAYPLYRFMLADEAARFKKYQGRVSASNLASINLHIQLGAKVGRIEDEFIHRKNK